MEYQDFTVDTTDREDHTFSGIFFDVTANERLPLKYVEIFPCPCAATSDP